jgi:hypothetical protein
MTNAELNIKLPEEKISFESSVIISCFSQKYITLTEPQKQSIIKYINKFLIDEACDGS